MAEFTLRIIQRNGTGQISINGILSSSGGDPIIAVFETGTAMTVSVIGDPGFTSFTILTKGISDFVYGDPDSTFTMGLSDAILFIDFSGTYTPPPPTGDRVKYVFDRTNIKDLAGGSDTEFELVIEEDGYTGLPITNRKLAGITLVWGRRNTDLIRDWLIPFQMEIGLVANRNDWRYDEFLTGDNRKFRALLKIKSSSDIFFEGYISPDVLTAPLQDGDYELSILAVEGFSAMQGTRAIPDRWIGTTSERVGYKVFGGSLNQTYGSFTRPFNISCALYETRMDDTDDAFAQFVVPDSILYEGEQDAVFTDGVRIENERLRLVDGLQRLVQPFIGRVFLWNNEFWFHRLADLETSNIKYFKYDPEPDGSVTLSNNYEIECFDNLRASEDLIRAYTEVTVALKLGKLTATARGSQFKCDFSIEHWFIRSTDGLWQLRRWRYENATPFNPKIPIFTGNTAQIYFLGDGDGFCRIYTTTTTAGTSDPNLSYIELMGTQYGENVAIVDEGANTVSFKVKFRITKNYEAAPSNIQNTYFGMMIRVGSNNWLKKNNDNSFEWVNTDTSILFNATGSVGLDYNIDIQKIPVPVTGEVTIRLYQLVITGGTKDQYRLDIDDFQFDVEENDALIEKEVAIKAVTDLNYSHVYEKVDVFMGDVPTSFSTSAIRLNDPGNLDPYTELWSRDGVEELQLIQVCAEEIMNRVGKRVRKISGYTTHFPDPRRAQIYDGVKWIVTWMNYDVYTDTWQIEIHEL
jgi:ribosomal protein S17E